MKAPLAIAATATLLFAAVTSLPAEIDGRYNLVHRGPDLPFSRPPGDMFIVEFAEAPLVAYTGGVAGLEATNPRARGESRLDPRSPASLAYLGYLERQQARHIATIELALGRPLQIVYRYQASDNGIATKLSPAEAEAILALPGVARVTPDFLEYEHTDRGPLWIRADAIWDGNGGGPASMGEGTVVGILDSGINMDHPSFSDTPVDGHVFDNPYGSGTFVGWCDPANPNFDPSYVCNDKLIGAWDFVEAYCDANPGICSENDGPEDNNSHGTHVASTAAGNVIDLSGNLQRDLSGVAPHANIISYDMAYVDAQGNGVAPFSAISASQNQAVLDGVVDAVNYSYGPSGQGGDPWASGVNRGFLDVMAAGVFVSTSAGNSGPGASTVGNLGPWLMAVAASTHDRETVENQLIDMAGGIGPPGDMTGASWTGGYGPEAIVYARNFDNGDPDPEQCLNPFPAGTWTSGEIVLCDRGTIARVLKCANVAAGGAAGCILANADAGQTDPVADPHVIPAIHVGFADGNALRNWLSFGVGQTGEITDSTVIINPAVADVTASFSSRGPNTVFSHLKPDVSAPGVSIFAAVATDGTIPPPEWGTLSGTSMASPHNAGAAALIRALHPTWTPTEIASALMMSADTTVTKEDGVTPADPFDMGAGRIDLSAAGRVALVLDETEADFLAADPGEGADPSELNLASLQQNGCVISCTFSRTFDSVASVSTDWNVTTTTPVGMTLTADPTNFTIAAGASQTVDFTANISGLPPTDWAFAEVQLAPVPGPDPGPDLHLPVAVFPAVANLPGLVTIATLEDQGTFTLQNMQSALEITDLDVQVSGLAQGTKTDMSLSQDSTNGDPYDNLNEVFFKTVVVPASARRLVAITSSDEAPDVDLYVGTGAVPSSGTQICSSTTPEADERCDIADPAAGTYWILVQNWSGSTNQPDAIRLLDGVVPGADAGNMTGTGPAAVPAGMPFDLDINWNEPDMAVDQIWFGVLDVGTDPGSPGNIATVAVDVDLVQQVVFVDGFESGDTTLWSTTVP